MLTELGLAALDEWLARPSPFPRIHSEAAVRVHASDLASDPRRVGESIAAMRQEIEEQERLLDEGERREPAFPHRRVQLRLLYSLGRRLLATHREWIEEVERELLHEERARSTG